MTIKIRSTEKHPHPIWQKIENRYQVVEIQGVVLESSDKELIKATKQSDPSIQLHFIEAVQADNLKELKPGNIFSLENWKKKIKAAEYFNSELLVLGYAENDENLFRLYQAQEYKSEGISLVEINVFKNENEFIDWWKTIKKLDQTKATVEAKSRQANTIFDGIIESNGYSWGGNIDGFILTDDLGEVKAIIEVRQSRSFDIKNYDPADFFKGTRKKGGDFKTWLPLVYLKKAYAIPLVLVTLSTKNSNKLGFTEVLSQNYDKLFYVDGITPKDNVTGDIDQFFNWLETQIIN